MPRRRSSSATCSSVGPTALCRPSAGPLQRQPAAAAGGRAGCARAGARRSRPAKVVSPDRVALLEQERGQRGRQGGARSRALRQPREP